MSNQTGYRKLFKLLLDTPPIQQPTSQQQSAGRSYALIHRSGSHVPTSLQIDTSNTLQRNIAIAESAYAIPTAPVGAQPQSWW